MQIYTFPIKPKYYSELAKAGYDHQRRVCAPEDNSVRHRQTLRPVSVDSLLPNRTTLRRVPRRRRRMPYVPSWPR